ncbi:MAG: hypothetical protein QM784_01235 [Polyangiaceae bacterium]
MLERQLGYDPHRQGSTSGVRVRVRPTDTGIEGTVDWSTSADEHVGERRFESRSDECQKLIATIGFVVAVQLQLMAEEAASETSVSTSSSNGNGALERRETGGAPEPLTSLTLTRRDFAIRLSTSHDELGRAVFAGVGPSVGFGLAPDPVALGRLFVAARLGWLGFEIGAERTLPARTTQDYGGGFEHVWTLGTVAACGFRGYAFVCGLSKLGNLHAEGFDVDRPASPDGFAWQVGPRLGYVLPVGDHFLLLGRAEALYLATPWTVHLNHVTVWSAPRVSAVAGIDIAARFR